jgi:hypothetical protein
LGLAEMIVWAAVLRSVQFHNIPTDSQDKELAVYEIVRDNGKCYLGFSFYLKKYEECLVIENRITKGDLAVRDYMFYSDMWRKDEATPLHLRGNYLLNKKGDSFYDSPYGIPIHFEKSPNSNEVKFALLKALKNFALPNKQLKLFILDTPLQQFQQLRNRTFRFKSFVNDITFCFLPEIDDLSMLDDASTDAVGIWKKHSLYDATKIRNSAIWSKIIHAEQYSADGFNNSVTSLIQNLQNISPEDNESYIENLPSEFATSFVMLAESALTRILIVDDRDLLGSSVLYEIFAYAGVSVFKVGDLENDEYDWPNQVTDNTKFIENNEILIPFPLQRQMKYAIKSMHLSLDARFNKKDRQKEWKPLWIELNKESPFFAFHTGKANPIDDDIGCLNVTDIEQFTKTTFDKINLVKLFRKVKRK